MFAFKITVLLIIALTGAMGQDVGFPENTLAVAGSNAHLYCKHYSSRCSNIKWRKRSLSGQIANISNGNRVYDGNKYWLNDSSICVLVIKNVQTSDSGTFICTIDESSYGFGDLIVLQAMPTCSSSCQEDVTAESERVDFECQLKFSGGGRPVMNWWNKKTKSAATTIPDGMQDSTSVSRDFSWNAAAPGFDPLICFTRFHFDQAAGRASNVPEVQCDTESCKILYSVRSVATWPLGFASPDEEITCSADGNPEPSFEWQWKEDDGDSEWENVDDEPSEKIVAFLNNGTSTQLRCVASNTVNYVEHSKESPEVKISKHGAAKRIGIIVGVVVGLVILAIIAVVVYKFFFSEQE